MKRHFLIAFIYIACFLHSSATAKITPSPPDMPEGKKIEALFSQASSYYDQKDFSRALLTFEKLLTEYPESPYYADVQSSFNSITQSLHLILFPEKLYALLAKEAAEGYTALTLERAMLLLALYPSQAILKKTLTFIAECYKQAPLRFSIYSVAKQNTALLYNGPVLYNEEMLLSFTYGTQTFLKRQGDILLYYLISSYNESTKQVTLKPLKYLPYRLQQNNHNETLREYSVTIAHSLLNRCYQGNIFLDELTTGTGTRLYGITKYTDENTTEFDVFNGTKTIAHTLTSNDINATVSYAIGVQQTLLNADYQTYIHDQNINLQRLNRLIELNYLPHALALYYWLASQDDAEENRTQLTALYNTAVSQIDTASFPERTCIRGIKELENGLLHTGWNTLSDIIEQYPDDSVSDKAAATLSSLASNSRNTMYVAALKPIPFPMTFMGYNKLSENDQRFQINYKGRSYFMKKNDVKAGYKILTAEEKIIEKINPQLNAPEKKQYRYLHVQHNSPLSEGIPLMPQESVADPDKLYCEFKDNLTGKLYPGYILLDLVVMNDGTEQYGAIVTSNASSKTQKEFLLYIDFDPSQPVFIRKSDTASIKILSYVSDESFDLLDRIYGKNFFTLLKKYSSILPAEFVEAPAVLTAEDTSAEKNVRSEESLAQDKTASEEKNSSTSVKKNGTNSKRVITAPNSGTDLTVRENQLLHKKRIIKVLGICIVLWLCIILIKIIRSLK